MSQNLVCTLQHLIKTRDLADFCQFWPFFDVFHGIVQMANDLAGRVALCAPLLVNHCVRRAEDCPPCQLKAAVQWPQKGLSRPSHPRDSGLTHGLSLDKPRFQARMGLVGGHWPWPLFFSVTTRPVLGIYNRMDTESRLAGFMTTGIFPDRANREFND